MFTLRGRGRGPATLQQPRFSPHASKCALAPHTAVNPASIFPTSHAEPIAGHTYISASFSKSFGLTEESPLDRLLLWFRLKLIRRVTREARSSEDQATRMVSRFKIWPLRGCWRPKEGLHAGYGWDACRNPQSMWLGAYRCLAVSTSFELRNGGLCETEYSPPTP